MNEPNNRADHLQWCKDRANEYLDNDDNPNAIASFMSDMNKHPETENHTALGIMTMLMMNGKLDTIPETRKFIDGFN